VTLPVTGNTISGPVFRRRRMPVFEWLRLPLTGNRWDIRWLSGRGKTPTMCVFPLFSIAVKERCVEASGYWEYHFLWVCWASEGACV
jgi:hypothetical protein